MSKLKPAVRIVLAPLAFRDPGEPALLVGEADKGARTVYIDPRCADPAKTLFHELTHVRHPGWSEAKVEAWENERWGRMSWMQKARYLQLFGSAIIKGREVKK